MKQKPVMCVYAAVKRDFIIAISQLEQPSCLMPRVYFGQKLYLDEFPSLW